MKKVFLCLLVATLLSGLVACAQPTVGGEVIQSGKQRLSVDGTLQTHLRKRRPNIKSCLRHLDRVEWARGRSLGSL